MVVELSIREDGHESVGEAGVVEGDGFVQGGVALKVRKEGDVVDVHVEVGLFVGFFGAGGYYGDFFVYYLKEVL